MRRTSQGSGQSDERRIVEENFFAPSDAGSKKEKKYGPVVFLEGCMCVQRGETLVRRVQRCNLAADFQLQRCQGMSDVWEQIYATANGEDADDMHCGFIEASDQRGQWAY